MRRAVLARSVDLGQLPAYAEQLLDRTRLVGHPEHQLVARPHLTERVQRDRRRDVRHRIAGSEQPAVEQHQQPPARRHLHGTDWHPARQDLGGGTALRGRPLRPEPDLVGPGRHLPGSAQRRRVELVELRSGSDVHDGCRRPRRPSRAEPPERLTEVRVPEPAHAGAQLELVATAEASAHLEHRIGCDAAEQGFAGQTAGRRQVGPPAAFGRRQLEGGTGLDDERVVRRHGTSRHVRLCRRSGDRDERVRVEAQRRARSGRLQQGSARVIADEDVGQPRRPAVARPVDGDALLTVAGSAEVLHDGQPGRLDGDPRGLALVAGMVAGNAIRHDSVSSRAPCCSSSANRASSMGTYSSRSPAR